MANIHDPNYSRRRFLQATGGTLAAAPLIGAVSPAAAQVPDIRLPEVPGQKVGWAIVGIGSLTANQILPAFPKCQKSKVAGFVSGRPEKANRFAQVYGVDPKNIYTYENFDSIADNPAIQAVYIVLPNSMHAEYTIRALKAGKHVLCEKPMANTAKDCEAMIAAAKAANRKLMVAYRCRYEPNNIRAIEMARDSSEGPAAAPRPGAPATLGMGPTRVIMAEMGFNIGNPSQWRLKKAMAGGGSMMDIGIYALNAARYLTGEEPTEVYAMISTTPNDPRFAEVEENVTFQLRFPSGILANCVSSYGTSFNKFRVNKKLGAFELDPATSYTGLRMRVFRPGGVIEDRSLPQRDHFQLEMDHFSDCIANNTEPLTPGEDGLKDMRIIEAIYQSGREGKPIKLA
jgi:glucose-fructose oxidoreductase